MGYGMGQIYIIYHGLLCMDTGRVEMFSVPIIIDVVDMVVQEHS